MILNAWHPACILLAGAALLPLMKGPFRKALLLLTPLVALAETLLCVLHKGLFFRFSLSHWQGIPDQLDSVALLVAPALVLLVWLGLLCTLHNQSRIGQGAVLVQAAGALGVLYSTTLPDLLLFWSLLVLSPVVLVWQGKGEGAARTGCRYLIWHASGYAVLLFSAALHSQSGDLNLDSLRAVAATPAHCLLLAGLGLGAALLPLHGWLPISCGETAPEHTLVVRGRSRTRQKPAGSLP